MRRISVAISDPLELSLVEAQRVYRRFELIQPDSRLQVIETGHRIFTYDGPIPVRVGLIYQNASLVRWCGRKLVSGLDAWQLGYLLEACELLFAGWSGVHRRPPLARCWRVEAMRRIMSDWRLHSEYLSQGIVLPFRQTVRERGADLTRFVLVTRPGDVSSLSYLLDFVKRPHTLFGTCVQKQRTSSTSCDNGVMSSAAGVARFRES